MKVEGAINGESKERETYRQYARIGVVPLDALDKKIRIAGYDYTVDGINTTGSKLILLREQNGKRYLYDRDVILRLIASANAVQVNA
jgi:hypothetical protein